MSQRESGYERKERDLYETPEWVTEALVSWVPETVDTVWECAAGNAMMGAVLIRRGFTVCMSDIEPNPSMGVSHGDFLQSALDPEAPAPHAVITNPPYEHALAFIERALKLLEPTHGFIAMLLRCDFDHAKSRAHIFRDCPAWSKKVVLTKRICWFEGGKSPSFNHAWYIWDWRHDGPPTIGYAP